MKMNRLFTKNVGLLFVVLWRYLFISYFSLLFSHLLFWVNWVYLLWLMLIKILNKFVWIRTVVVNYDRVYILAQNLYYSMASIYFDSNVGSLHTHIHSECFSINIFYQTLSTVFINNLGIAFMIVCKNWQPSLKFFSYTFRSILLKFVIQLDWLYWYFESYHRSIM